MKTSPKSSFVVRESLKRRPWAAEIFLLCLLLAVVAAPAIFSAVAGAQDTGSEAADLRAIEEVALDYLEGGRDGDFERLSRAFHPSARLQFVKNGVYTEWSIEDYLNGRKGAEPRQATLEVHSIELAGTCAVAKVESDYGQVGFVDYLSLLKIEGRWFIVNKVFNRS